jgi:hypothetical protein
MDRFPLRSRVAAVVLATLALPLAAACRKAEPPPPPAPAPQRLESAALGLVFTVLPTGFTVTRNEGATVTLTADRAGVPATVEVTVGPRETSTIYLVERAKAFQAEVAAAGGKFFGGNELVTPFGSAQTVRATVDGGEIEERRILMLHPADPDRLLQITMRHPPGDAQAARDRLVQLMDLLAVMEPLPPAAG